MQDSLPFIQWPYFKPLSFKSKSLSCRRYQSAFGMKRLLALMTLPALLCCSDDRSGGQSALRDTAVILRVQTTGESLTNYLNTIDTQNIRLLYRQEDELVTVLTGGDYPFGYFVFEESPDVEKMIKLFCYVGGNNENEETFINWDGEDLDTLSYKVSRYSSGNVVISQVKFNGEAIVPNDSGIYNVSK